MDYDDAWDVDWIDLSSDVRSNLGCHMTVMHCPMTAQFRSILSTGRRKASIDFFLLSHTYWARNLGAKIDVDLGIYLSG